MKNLFLNPFLVAGLSILTFVGCSNTSNQQQTELQFPNAVDTARAFDFESITIATMGDSISVGYATEAIFSPSLENNWSTGVDLPGSGSHLQRLQDLAIDNDFTVRSLNVAREATRVVPWLPGFNLEDQVESLSPQLFTNSFNYVTLMMGSNDVCQTNSSHQDLYDDIKGEMTLALNTIGPKSDLILVPSILNLDAALNTPGMCPWGDFIQDLARTNFCPNSTRVDFQGLIQTANSALEDAVRESQFNVLWDNQAVNSTALTPSMLSDKDCFHPSTLGQQAIADSVWPAVENALRSYKK